MLNKLKTKLLWMKNIVTFAHYNSIVLQPNRIGKVTEYKQGHFYLTHTEWEDGHCEIEVHHCEPQPLFHSCDQKQLEIAKKKLNQLFLEEK